MEEEARDWLKIAAAALAIIVTIGLSLIAVLTELQQTARHDQEHSVFREDIRELREECKTCRK
jgi:hypothetical protein